MVALPDADGAAKDSNPVGGGGLTEGTVSGSGLGGLGEDLDGETPVQAAVGPLVVVMVTEAVELGLELGQAGGRGLLGEPFLQGLMEAFHLAAGLGVVGTGMTGFDPQGPTASATP